MRIWACVDCGATALHEATRGRPPKWCDACRPRARREYARRYAIVAGAERVRQWHGTYHRKLRASRPPRSFQCRLCSALIDWSKPLGRGPLYCPPCKAQRVVEQHLYNLAKVKELATARRKRRGPVRRLPVIAALQTMAEAIQRYERRRKYRGRADRVFSPWCDCGEVNHSSNGHRCLRCRWPRHPATVEPMSINDRIEASYWRAGEAYS